MNPDQDKLASFDAGVDDQEPVAWSYEIKRTLGEDGPTKIEWNRRLSREKPDPDSWRQTDTEYYHFRNITPLRYSRDQHPDALGYEFTFQMGDGVETDLTKDDLRHGGPDSLISCRPLVPLNDN